VEVLKQGQFSPLPMEKQVAIIFAGANGYLDDIAVEDVRRFEAELYVYLDNSKPEILGAIRDKKQIDDDTKSKLNAALKEFKGRFKSRVSQTQTRNSDSSRNGSGQRPAAGPDGQVVGQVDRDAQTVQNRA
jgi:ATP synthase alpha/beta chain, C terminal domain